MTNETYSDERILVVFGSSEKMEEVLDGQVHLTVTSPPYYDMKHTMVWKDYDEYLAAMERNMVEIFRVTKIGGVCAINVSDYPDSENHRKLPLGADWTRLGIKVGFNYEDTIIWKKPEHTMRNVAKRAGVFMQTGNPLHYRPDNITEFIIIFRKGRIETYRRASKEQKEPWEKWKHRLRDVWEFRPVMVAGEKEYHPAMLPDELPLSVISLYSLRGDTVLDPFLGSGTTLKVCMELGRFGIGYEMNPDYKRFIDQKLGVGTKRLDSFGLTEEPKPVTLLAAEPLFETPTQTIPQ